MCLKVYRYVKETIFKLTQSYVPFTYKHSYFLAHLLLKANYKIHVKINS